MFDREMRYLAVSRRWLEDYSLVDSEIIGRSHYEIVPDIPERWKEAHRRGLAGETLKVDEDRFEHADGTVQWIRWEVVPWRAGDGSVGGIVLFAEDITAQKANGGAAAPGGQRVYRRARRHHDHRFERNDSGSK